MLSMPVERSEQKSITQTIYVSYFIEKTHYSSSGCRDFEKLVESNSLAAVDFLPGSIYGAEIGYVRDMFQVFDDLVLVSEAGEVSSVKKILGREAPVVLSELGIGGNVVRSEKLLIIPEELREEPVLPLLMDRGYLIDFLPIPNPPYKDELASRMGFSRHLDMEINVVKNKDGWVFVVNDDYFRKYKQRIAELLEKYNGSLVVICDKAEQTLLRAVNFIELPNGKVILPSNCEETIAKLTRVLGKDRVLSVDFDCSLLNGQATTRMGGNLINLWFHGGLRCMANTNY